MAIYTKRGDKGMTSLYDSQNLQNIRVSKSSQIVRTIGTIDETNSYLGTIFGALDPETKKEIQNIQSSLFTIGSLIAGAKLSFSARKTLTLEEKIDKMEKVLPPLKNFILPGGNEVAAKLHYARSMARRMEREVVELTKQERLRPEILTYINRLSDYLFVLARWVNKKAQIKEEAWLPLNKR
ncbi:cob(I)yrinic acid a,c-diamide adenosyltransferase [Candidatus Woesebacteria bacterium]|nr:cob(I)yrinic acid a,c-diamide adenosyltransferase [Candidatus Woesebacteria bacterium]